MEKITQTRKKQLIDFYILQNLDKKNTRQQCLAVSAKIWEDYQINVNPSTVYNRVRQVQSCKTLTPLATFPTKNGIIPGDREGKDRVYEGLWAITDILIPNKYDRNYIGLAATQVDVIAKNVSGSITICENNEEIYKKQKDIVKYFTKPKYPSLQINLNYGDIFTLLATTKDKFNIIDLDLMKPFFSEQEGKEFIRTIQRITKELCVVSITSYISRNTSIRQHIDRVILFRKHLGSMELGYSHPEPYKDRIHSMWVERFIIGGNNEKGISKEI